MATRTIRDTPTFDEETKAELLSFLLRDMLHVLVKDFGERLVVSEFETIIDLFVSDTFLDWSVILETAASPL